MVAHADDPWRMLAVCVIGQALDDIAPRTGPRYMGFGVEAMEQAQAAMLWVEGAPAAFPARLACDVAGIGLAVLREEAEARAQRRWPQGLAALEATVAA